MAAVAKVRLAERFGVGVLDADAGFLRAVDIERRYEEGRPKPKADV